MSEIAEIKRFAKEFGWKFIKHQKDISMLSFKKGLNLKAMRINIYLTKMTVATSLNHPFKGKTQLYRKRVGRDLMRKIFENPRVHTDKGYQKKWR